MTTYKLEKYLGVPLVTGYVLTSTTAGIRGWVPLSSLSSGVYTPTRSAEVNLDSAVTMSEAQYLRVGNTATVSGRFTADPTLTATQTSFEITLPIASNIGAIEDVAGTAVCGTVYGLVASILGSVANDTALIRWISSDVSSTMYSYHFTYQII